MTFGPGRPPAEPEIFETRALRPGEAEATPRGRVPAIKAIRDSHHMLARLLVLGIPVSEVAARCGYSISRVSVLKADPAFAELMAYYRGRDNEAWTSSTEEYYGNMIANRNYSARMLNDRLSTGEAEDFTISQLIAIHADAADRTGFGKRTTAVNVNLDFAAALDRAIARSAKVLDSPPHGPEGEVDGSATTVNLPALRRAQS